MHAKQHVGIGVALIAFLALGGAFLLAGRPAHQKPLGEAPAIQFQSTAVPDENIKAFLNGDYELIKTVAGLPEPIRELYTETGGSRFVLADPGKHFEATDFIIDASVPRERLIFAGLSGKRCFVHYEQGGRGHSFHLALFELTSPSAVTPLWQGSCGPAKDLNHLRAQLRAGCDR